MKYKILLMACQLCHIKLCFAEETEWMTQKNGWFSKNVMHAFVHLSLVNQKVPVACAA